jgi:hypothetical protein
VECLNRPPVKLGVLFIYFLFLSGCSSLNSLIFPNQNKIAQKSLLEQDYIDQINNQGEVFLEENRRKIIRLSNRTKNYFSNLVLKIRNSNEKYFEGGVENYSLHIIRDKTPYYFALPNGKIIFSSGVVKKYIDNEALFAVLVSKLVYISSKKIYIKKISIPRGAISTIEMMKIVDLPLNVRGEVNKWTFHIMTRAGLDGLAVLNWIQIQNKNILDFSMMYKDLNLISREEYEFKNFMALNNDRTFLEKSTNSSRSFYAFKKELKRNGTIVPIRRTSY